MRGFLLKIAGAVAAVVMLTGAAVPQAPDIAGTYEVEPAKGKVSFPACVRRWTLRRDGSFLIEDGQEQVTGQWRLQPANRMEWWLVMTDRADNGLPDCGGRTVAAGPFDDGRLSFYVNSAGGLVLTKVVKTLPDGTPLFGIDAILDKVARP